jgi:hypothetical protein
MKPIPEAAAQPVGNGMNGLNGNGMSAAEAFASGNVNPMDISNPSFGRSGSHGGSDDENVGFHVPHPLCKLS